jgi:PAS domain S-box-containing protein
MGTVHIKLDGKDFEEGSAAHLEKIEDVSGVEGRARLVDEDLEKVAQERRFTLLDEKLARANAAIRQCETRFRVFVNGVRDYALYMLDPSGHVVSWNAGAERVKGYVAQEILGKHLSVFYEPDDVKDGRPQRTLAAAAATGRAEDEGWRVRKDGSTFWANVVLAPIHNATGVLLGFAKVTHDLTERRHLEEQLHQSQKMEAIGILAGGLAHDFNNLLSIVLSYSDLLAADLRDDDPMRGDLGEIHHAGLRGVALMRQLLAFSRQQVLHPRLVDLTQVVQGMDRMLRRLIGEDVELSVICAPVLGKVLVDPGQMEQVIMNLAVNARDAMPGGGKLTIETAEVVLDQEYASAHPGVKPGPHIMLAVSDTGAGMDEATQARMFDPFFTTKEAGKGTGLGLATVFGIIRQSCGTIEACSEPAKGTEITIYFPTADKDAIERVSSNPPAHPVVGGSETILLVEDDEPVRVLTRTILRRYGYDVVEAQSGGDALLLCEQHPTAIHLLLTDIVMPRMSGAQLADRLVTIRPEMKVLYMSGYANDAVMRQGVLGPPIAFIQKPITPEALARKVRDTLDAVRRAPS